MIDRRTVLIALLAPAVAGPSLAVAATKKVETERIIVAPQPPIEGLPTGTDAKTAGDLKGPEIHKDLDSLPAKVSAMRKKILEAAYSGDMERLRAVIHENETPPIFSINEIVDPIDYLKGQSGDGAGLEILAILTDVLEAGWARVDPGGPNELYVWPYFATVPIDHLTDREMVELYKFVTSGDFEEMKSAGKYSFYTVGISADGAWHYFKLND
ncbi:MAG: hypothetical protein P4L98_07855 [Ancalomicrobiaceae bacterium]|nr:hypothetical protein [Ancalomicrobiaceae bacterium]